MKSIINFTPQEKIQYPCLMRWKNSNLVVLFTGNKTGVCLSVDATDVMNKIGADSDAWDEGEFVPLKPGESVTLSND